MVLRKAWRKAQLAPVAHRTSQGLCWEARIHGGGARVPHRQRGLWASGVRSRGAERVGSGHEDEPGLCYREAPGVQTECGPWGDGQVRHRRTPLRLSVVGLRAALKPQQASGSPEELSSRPRGPALGFRSRRPARGPRVHTAASPQRRDAARAGSTSRMRDGIKVRAPRSAAVLSEAENRRRHLRP